MKYINKKDINKLSKGSFTTERSPYTDKDNGVDTYNTKTAVSTGNNKAERSARRSKSGPYSLYFYANDSKNGAIIKIRRNHWKNVFKTSVREDVCNLMNELNRLNDTNKKSIVRSALKNILHCSIFEYRARLFGRKHDTIKLCGVMDLFNDSEKSYLKLNDFYRGIK
jgi:hypothetical protein